MRKSTKANILAIAVAFHEMMFAHTGIPYLAFALFGLSLLIAAIEDLK